MQNQGPTIVIAPQPMFGENPMQVTCGNCQHHIATVVTKENGACAYISALFTCLICPCCFWVPLIMESCKDVYHTCPSCGAALGSVKKC